MGGNLDKAKEFDPARKHVVSPMIERINIKRKGTKTFISGVSPGM